MSNYETLNEMRDCIQRMLEDSGDLKSLVTGNVDRDVASHVVTMQKRINNELVSLLEFVEENMDEEEE